MSWPNVWTWVVLASPWALPLAAVIAILFLLDKKDRRQWAVTYRWRIALGWAVWYAGWTSVVLVAASEGKNPWLWLATATLRGLSALGNVFLTPWFLLGVVILSTYGRQIGDLLNRLAQNVKTIEVSGLKLCLGDPNPVVTGMTVGWWSDRPVGGSDTADAAGSDGPLQERPLGPYAAYEQCLHETERLLTNMTQEHHWTYGKQLRMLEWSWIGEYAEQLEQSVRLLRQAVRDQRIQVYTYRYLATGLPVRHMILYLYGRTEHAQQFFADLMAIDRLSLIFVLKEPITYWFLVHLCDRRQFDYAQKLVDLHELRDPDLAFTRRSMDAYLHLKMGKYPEAAAQSVACLAEIEQTGTDVPLPRAVFHYVASMANLKVGMPSAALPHAEAVRKDNSVAAVGLRSHLRRHSIRLYVQACYQLQRYERISQLLIDDPDAAVDPFVLNALAVAQHTEGDTKAAAFYLMRAIDLLPPAGEDELRQTILTNRKLLNI